MSQRIIRSGILRWWVCLCLLPWAAASANEGIDFSSMIRQMSDLDNLAMPQNYDVRMLSTYDREGLNRDAYNFLEKDNDRAVLAEFEGPGVITRIFSASPGGIIRIFLDGEDEPIMDMKALEFFSGSHEPFLEPLVASRGGHYSYFPIPFSRSARVEIGYLAPVGARGDKGFGAYWQVSCRIHPEGTRVKSLDLPLTEDERIQLDTALEFFSRESFFIENSDLILEERAVEIGPGDKEEVFSRDGAGSIKMFSITCPDGKDLPLSQVLLKIFWDDEDEPSVNCPAGAFFGNAWGMESPQGLMERLPGGGRSCFPMPFEKSARIVLHNDGPYPSGPVKIKVLIQASRSETPLRFHAIYRQERTQAHPASPNMSGENNYIVLKTQGRGHYVGAILHVYNIYQVWWGEGDEMFFLDRGSWPPSLHGTGTEDYFDSAWCSFSGSPFAGAAITNTLGRGYAGKNALYRFHIADPIPFKEKIKFSLEHGRVTNDLDNLYASVAFWYQDEPHSTITAPPPFSQRFLDEQAMARKVQEKALAATPWFLRSGFFVFAILFVITGAVLVFLLIRKRGI